MNWSNPCFWPLQGSKHSGVHWSPRSTENSKKELEVDNGGKECTRGSRKALKEGDLKLDMRDKEPGDVLSWAYPFPPHPFQRMLRLNLSVCRMSRDYKGKWSSSLSWGSCPGTVFDASVNLSQHPGMWGLGNYTPKSHGFSLPRGPGTFLPNKVTLIFLVSPPSS